VCQALLVFERDAGSLDDYGRAAQKVNHTLLLTTATSTSTSTHMQTIL
jgi:hypothetical protein